LIVATLPTLVCGSTPKTRRAMRSNGHHLIPSPQKSTAMFLAELTLNELSFVQLSFKIV